MTEAAQAEATESVEAEATEATESTPASGSLLGNVQPGETPTPTEDQAGGEPDPLAKFRDEEGNLVSEKLTQAYTELQSKLGQRKDILKEELQKELKEAAKDVPESPEKYEIPTNLGIEGADIKVDETDPMVEWWRKTAHEMHLPQSQFQDAIKQFVNAQAQQLPDLNEVVKELGENATDRINATDSWLEANLPNKDWYAAIAEHANNADFIRAIEHLVNQVREPNFSGQEGIAQNTSRLTIDELRTMQDDPRYWRDKDPAFIQKVQNGYKRLFGK